MAGGDCDGSARSFSAIAVGFIVIGNSGNDLFRVDAPDQVDGGAAGTITAADFVF
jgi:hypothetical protein